MGAGQFAGHPDLDAPDGPLIRSEPQGVRGFTPSVRGGRFVVVSVQPRSVSGRHPADNVQRALTLAFRVRLVFNEGRAGNAGDHEYAEGKPWNLTTNTSS